MNSLATLTHHDLTLEYLTIGTGKTIIFAFHGFGRHASDYNVFEPVFGEKYTLFAFNLFHHGKSAYPAHRIEKDTLTKGEITQLFKKFMAQKQIKNFAVMGYSLGGKIALMLAELFPDQLREIWLFAPDGIKLNFWYKAASKTRMGRAIYKHFLHHPQAFISMTNSLHQAGIINQKLKKFALKNMASTEDRMLVYNVWLTFKDTNPNMRVVIQEICSRGIPVYQFFGKNDQVIRPKLGKWFARKIKQPNGLFILPAGHHLLTAKTASFIQSQNLI